MNERECRAPRGIFYERVCDKQWNIKCNAFLDNAVLCLAVIAFLCVVGYLFALELVVYTIDVLLMSAIVLFAKNIGKTVLFIPFLFITPSPSNNPAINGGSFLSQTWGIIYLATIGVIYLGLMAVAMIKDRKLIVRRAPTFGLGFLILGCAYLCSGAFSPYFSLQNFRFSAMQIASLCVCYFLALYAVDWQEMKKDTFAWISVFVALVLMVELLYVYLFNDVFERGHLMRGNLYTGWGIHNNLGNYLCTTLAGIFYLVIQSRRKILFFVLACATFGAIVLTTSRGSVVAGIVVFTVCYILMLRSLKGTKLGKWFTVGLFVALVFAVGIFTVLLFTSQVLQNTLGKLLETESGLLNSAGRVDSWKVGLKQFTDYPIFGAGFYECSAYQFGTESMGFIPARWHNTFVQLLASCGIVGLLAYAFHRYQTVVFVIKNKSTETFFLALTILPILIGGLFDNHLFNIGPGLIYGLFLAFMEGFVNNKMGGKENENSVGE